MPCRDPPAASPADGLGFKLAAGPPGAIDPRQADPAGSSGPIRAAGREAWPPGRTGATMPAQVPTLETFPMDPASTFEPTCPVIPVIVLDDAADAVPLARACLAGGLDILEVTLRTPVALEAIRRRSEEHRVGKECRARRSP